MKISYQRNHHHLDSSSALSSLKEDKRNKSESTNRTASFSSSSCEDGEECPPKKVGVRFDPTVQVCLVPTRRELDKRKHDIWWDSDELQQGRDEADTLLQGWKRELLDEEEKKKPRRSGLRRLFLGINNKRQDQCLPTAGQDLQEIVQGIRVFLSPDTSEYEEQDASARLCQAAKRMTAVRGLERGLAPTNEAIDQHVQSICHSQFYSSPTSLAKRAALSSHGAAKLAQMWGDFDAQQVQDE